MFMDYIIRNTTPTFTLTILEPVPEDAVPSVIVTQDSVTYIPELEFDRTNNKVSFSLTSEETGEFEAGNDIYIQQTMNFPDGSVEKFPLHVVSVADMLYQGEPVLPQPSSLVVARKTTDTSVSEGIVYYDVLYSEVEVHEGDSPIDMGLLEYVNNEYVLSQDMVPVDGSIYYRESYYPVTPVGNENPSVEGWMIMEEKTFDAIDESYGGQDDSLYQPVVPNTGDNPSELGWLELDENDLYVNTLDTTPQSGKMYYTTLEDLGLPDNIDAIYSGFDKEAFYAKNNLVSVDDVDFSQFTGGDTEWTVDSDATGGAIPDSDEWSTKPHIGSTSS